jgi:ATP-dependent RNA helicase HelY
VLLHLQIEEIFVTELVLAGILDELDPATLFGVLCAVTNELGRHVDRLYRLSREDRGLIQRLDQIRRSGPVTEAEEITRTAVVWDPDLLPLGRAWAEGRNLQEILAQISSRTDIAGDLITGFRRAKDLAGQLRDVWRQVPDRGDMLTALIRKVSRDEVEVLD